MTQRNLEFTYTLATSFVEKGDTDRAIVTILNSLLKAGVTINDAPQLIGLLVSIMKEGYEDDVVRIHFGSPLDHPFIPKFCMLLEQAGKKNIADRIQRAADNYLREQKRKQHYTLTTQMPSGTAFRTVKTTRESCEVLHISKRFDRVTRIPSVPSQSTRIFVENGVDRAILDFDNRIPVTTDTSRLNDASITPFRTFAEDVQDAILSDSQMNARVAPPEKAPELAQIKPFAVRHPRRFSIPPRLLSTLVIICVVGTFTGISWGAFQTHSEDAMLREMSAVVGTGSDSEINDALSLVNAQPGDAAKTARMQAYQSFLSSWKAEMYNDPEDPQSFDERDPNAPASIAAQINQLLLSGDVQTAKEWADALSEESFGNERYYYHWIRASVEDAMQSTIKATQLYDKILNSPLAGFAAARLGKLALVTGHPLPTQKFLNFALAERNEKSSSPFTLCAIQLLAPESALPLSQWEHIKAPYLQFCQIASIQQSLNNGELHADEWIDKLQKFDEPSIYREKLITDLYIRSMQLEKAIESLKSLSLPGNHPERLAFQNRIINSAINAGQSQLIRGLYPEIPAKANESQIIRFVDLKRAFPTYAPDTRISDWPGFLYDSRHAMPDQMPEQPYLAELHKIYQSAYTGDLSSAYRSATRLSLAYPDAIEPFILRTDIMAASGKNMEAVTLIQENLAAYPAQLPLRTRAALYTLRAGYALSDAEQQSLLSLAPEDLSIQADLTEIAWRSHDPSSAQRIQNLSETAPQLRHTAYLVSQMTPAKDPAKQAILLQNAFMGALSPSGLPTQRAKNALLNQSGRTFVESASQAILFPPHDVDMPLELARYYKKNFRSYEGTKKMEYLLKNVPETPEFEILRGNLHYAAALLYNPSSAHPSALQHLQAAQELLGDNQAILNGFLQYYTKKEKPLQIKKYREAMEKLRLSQADVDIDVEY